MASRFATSFDSVSYLVCGCYRNIFWDLHHACPFHAGREHFQYITENFENPLRCLPCSSMPTGQREKYVTITAQVFENANNSASSQLATCPQLASSSHASHHALPVSGGVKESTLDLTADAMSMDNYGGMYDDSDGGQGDVASATDDGLPCAQAQQATLEELSEKAETILKKILPAASKANNIVDEEEAAKGPNAPFKGLQLKPKKVSSVPLWPMLADLRLLSEDNPTGAFKTSVARGRPIDPKVQGLNLDERPWPVPDPLFRDVFPSLKKFAPSTSDKPKLPAGPKRQLEDELQNVWCAGSRITSAVATGGLVASYAAALVDPTNPGHVKAVSELGVDYQNLAAALDDADVLRFIEELFDCVYVLSATLMTAATESFVVTTATSQARRRMWLAEANVNVRIHNFLMSRKITPRMLFSLDEDNMKQLKEHMKNVESLEKAFGLEAQPATKPAGAAAPATRHQKWRAAFRGRFQENAANTGRGRGRGGSRGKGQNRGRGSFAQHTKKGRGSDPSAGPQA